jgi:hypothetical protein
MNKINGFKDVVSSLIIATGLLAISAPGYSVKWTPKTGH